MKTGRMQASVALVALALAAAAWLATLQVTAIEGRPGLKGNASQRVPFAQASGTETVRDTFTVESYSNNDGTQPWASNWIEFGDDGLPERGQIKIDKGLLQIKEASRSIQRTVDLSAATSAVLTLDYRRKGDMDSEYVALEISTDGGTTWATLGRFSGPGQDDDMLPARYDLSPYRAAGTTIRFATSPGLGGDRLYVDNVQVEYTVGTAPTLTPLPTATSTPTSRPTPTATVPPSATLTATPTPLPTTTVEPTPTRKPLGVLYVPVIAHRWVWWYLHDAYEPNGSVEEAYGPLLSGQVYRAYVWNEQDKEDYYSFTPVTGADVQVTLSNIPPGCDYDLYVYRDDGTYRLVAFSNRVGDADETVAFVPTPGLRHYVRVYPYSGASSAQPYELWALYR